jgi:pimeloyl-ACP methyl ester carboxylesterase
VVTVLQWAAVLFVLTMACGALVTRLQARRAVAEYPPSGRWLDVEGTRLNYVDRGEGRPVLLIHGLRGSLYEFEASISDRLAQSCRVVVFDRPGHGYSSPLPGESHSLALEAKTLHSAATKLGLRRPLLVGYSFGGAVAMAYADAYPDDVQGVVTVSGHVMPYEVHVGPLAFFARRPLIAGVSSNTLLLPVGRLLGRMILRRVCSPRPVPGPYLDAVLAMALRPRTFRYVAVELRESARELRLIARRYRSLPVHVTVLAGRDDAISSAKEAQWFHKRLARSTLVVVPGGGHALHATHPDVVAAAVLRASGRPCVAWPVAGGAPRSFETPRSPGARHRAMNARMRPRTRAMLPAIRMAKTRTPSIRDRSLNLIRSLPS